MTDKTLDAEGLLRAQLDMAGNERLREIHAYWRSRIVDGRLPARRDIDPGDIPRLLPGLFLVDVIAGPPRRFHFRLVGTQIARIEGELTGKHLDEIMRADTAAEVMGHYEDACRRVIYVCDRSLEWPDRDSVDYSVLLLPLAEDGRTVDRLLGYALYRTV